MMDTKDAARAAVPMSAGVGVTTATEDGAAFATNPGQVSQKVVVFGDG